jgi:prepilin-type N-terminal cleavage/methylation domain-containing protein
MRRKLGRTGQSGFSLLELTLVLLILSLVMGVTMTAINDVQKRARVEEAKVDLTQEAREFVEQMVRDLHQAGYPTSAMYTTPQAPGSALFAQGLIPGTATTTSLQFEGDVDGDGQVDVVQYQLITDPDPIKAVPAGQCPCVLQRSQLPKGVAGTNFTQEVDGVINSSGPGGRVIAGATSILSSGGGSVANNVRYAPYKNDPIFRYYKSDGSEITPPFVAPLSEADVRAVRVTVNTLSTVLDTITNTYPAGSMTASARIANK